jgi:hypothetical protein
MLELFGFGGRSGGLFVAVVSDTTGLGSGGFGAMLKIFSVRQQKTYKKQCKIK